MGHEIKDKLCRWIEKKNPSLARGEIGYDTNIIESRIISSLQIMDLILFMESLRGKPINSRNIKSGVFSSVNSIYETFFREEVSCE